MEKLPKQSKTKRETVSAEEFAEFLVRGKEKMEFCHLDEVFDARDIKHSQVDNLTYVLNEYSEYIDFSSEIAQLKKLKFLEGAKVIGQIKECVLNSDTHNLEPIMYHKVAYLSSNKDLPENFKDLHTALMDLMYKVAEIKKDFDRMSNTLYAQGRVEESDRLWAEKQDDPNARGHSMTVAELEANKDELLEILERAEKGRERAFGSDFNLEEFQMELDKTKMLIKDTFKME